MFLWPRRTCSVAWYWSVCYPAFTSWEVVLLTLPCSWACQSEFGNNMDTTVMCCILLLKVFLFQTCYYTSIFPKTTQILLYLTRQCYKITFPSNLHHLESNSRSLPNAMLQISPEQNIDMQYISKKFLATKQIFHLAVFLHVKCQSQQVVYQSSWQRSESSLRLEAMFM